MSVTIDDALIDYVAELSRLKLIGEEREAAKRDLSNVLAQVEVLGEVDVMEWNPSPIPAHRQRHALRYGEGELSTGADLGECAGRRPGQLPGTPDSGIGEETHGYFGV